VIVDASLSDHRDHVVSEGLGDAEALPTFLFQELEVKINQHFLIDIDALVDDADVDAVDVAVLVLLEDEKVTTHDVANKHGPDFDEDRGVELEVEEKAG
jgi:hypothetical protein